MTINCNFRQKINNIRIHLWFLRGCAPILRTSSAGSPMAMARLTMLVMRVETLGAWSLVTWPPPSPGSCSEPHSQGHTRDTRESSSAAVARPVRTRSRSRWRARGTSMEDDNLQNITRFLPRRLFRWKVGISEAVGWHHRLHHEWTRRTRSCRSWIVLLTVERSFLKSL